jgi:hypothetical protein
MSIVNIVLVTIAEKQEKHSVKSRADSNKDLTANRR